MFLVIEGAVENALPKSIGSALTEKGLESTITVWINTMLIDRTPTTTLQDEATGLKPPGAVHTVEYYPRLGSFLMDELFDALDRSCKFMQTTLLFCQRPRREG